MAETSFKQALFCAAVLFCVGLFSINTQASPDHAASYVLRDGRIYYAWPRFSFPAAGAQSARDLHHLAPAWARRFPGDVAARYRLLGLSTVRGAALGYRWNLEIWPDEPHLNLSDYIAYRHTDRPPAELSGTIELLAGPYQTRVNNIPTEYAVVHQTFDDGTGYLELLVRYQISESQALRLWIIKDWDGTSNVPSSWYGLMEQMERWDDEEPDADAPDQTEETPAEDELISALTSDARSGT